MMKRCRVCEKDLPLEMFGPRRATCNDCKRARDRAYAQSAAGRESRRRRAKELYADVRVAIEELKGRPCMDCGVQYPSYVMQFDHRIPATKRTHIAQLCGSGHLPTVLKEVAKCDVVCANCHHERTHQQRQNGIARPTGRPRKE